ncbi:MAG: hypothetical protein REI78_13310 [Pedobacter sp.]|nr:hypothetical protein [Pedobacter sp.]MDQ8054006.1 hypothetical protein [Pedobacter sp.]
MLFIIFCGLGCSISNKDHIVIFEFSDNFRTFKPNAQIEEDNGTYKIIYFKKYVMYELSSIRYNVKTKVVNGEEINEMYPSTDTINSYFILEKEKNNGLKYDSISVLSPKPFDRDSLIKTLVIDKENLAIFNLDLGKPEKVIRNPNDPKIWVEYYYNGGGKNSDSIYRYYDDRLAHIDFSFSDSLDRKHKSKLVRTDFIHLPRKEKGSDGKEIIKPRTEMITSITLIKTTNEEKYRNLFNRFEADSK